MVVPIPVLAGGATQITGIGWPPSEVQCLGVGVPEDELPYDFATALEGDIEGCQYVWVDSFKCSPGGTYLETGRELYVASYEGETRHVPNNVSIYGEVRGLRNPG